MYGDICTLDYLIGAYNYQNNIQSEKVLEMQCSKKLTPFLTTIKYKKFEFALKFIQLGWNVYAKADKLQNALHIAT